MKLQTRLSGLLFFLLLGVAAGSALVVQDAVRNSVLAQSEQLNQVLSLEAHNRARSSALLGARTLRTLIEARLTEVRARGEALSSAPGPGEALIFRSPEGLRRVNETLAAAGRSLSFQRLVDLGGYLATPHQTADPTSTPPSGSLLTHPVLPTSPPLQTLLKTGLGGNPVASLELLSSELLTHLAPGRTGPSEPSAASLVLLSIQPVRGPDKQVVGAILSGLELAQDAWILETWQRQVGLEGATGALLQQGRRIAVQGSTWAKGSRLEEAEWQKLQGETEVVTETTSGTVVRLALRNATGQTIGAVEVSAPLAGLSLNPGRENATGPQEQVFQNALTMIGALAIIGLFVGLLAARRTMGTLARLSRKAELVSTGRLDASFKDLSGKDELGELARSFERMRVSLKKLMERQQRMMAGGDPPNEGSTAA